MTSFTDQEISGYKVQKAIGEGKFSTVYRAQNAEGNIIALKKIKIFDMMDPKQREKCLKEVKLMQPLQHPNIIRYLDSFIYKNELIIATEWAEKGDLKRLIRSAQSDETPFEEVTLWSYIRQIASALAHMHEKRIMHRDLKPANIFIAGDNSLKVGDLGLGRVFSSETIEAYSKVGTPLYMSPELLQGEGYDMKSDVWSLGCIAYEMCEFHSPFRQNDKMSLMDLFNNITKGEYKSISNRYSQELRDLIDNMIVVDPAKRLDATLVLSRAEHHYTIFSESKATPQIYNMLIMEDIYEKLALVGYHQYFCVPLKRSPVSKFYFALESDNQNQKFQYFMDLCYWLMGLPKKKTKIATAMKFTNADECARKLLIDIKQWGVKVPEGLHYTQITNGSGDMVCYILNDLLNRELIRVNFKFASPVFGVNIEAPVQELQQLDNEEEVEEEQSLEDVEQDILTQSIIFYQKKFNHEMPDYNSVPLERAIIEGQVAPTEWLKELNRVEKDLTKIELNLKINKNLKDYQKSILDWNEHAQMFNLGAEFLRSSMIQELQESWISDLDQIPRLEDRLTNQVSKEQLNEIKQQQEELEKLKATSSILSRDVQQKIQQDQMLTTQISDLNEQSPDQSDRRPQLRKAITQLKDDIKQMDIRIRFLQTVQLRRPNIQFEESWTE